MPSLTLADIRADLILELRALIVEESNELREEAKSLMHANQATKMRHQGREDMLSRLGRRIEAVIERFYAKYA